MIVFFSLLSNIYCCLNQLHVYWNITKYTFVSKLYAGLRLMYIGSTHPIWIWLQDSGTQRLIMVSSPALYTGLFNMQLIVFIFCQHL